MFSACLYLAAVAGSAIALSVAYYIARYFWELIPEQLERPLNAVFITGCDTGFGRLLALKCAQAGFFVYAGCLTPKGAESILEEAKQLACNILTVLIDVTNKSSVEEARDLVIADLMKTPGKKLWALVNNAGVFTAFGPDAWCTVEDYERAVDVNTLGAIRCTHAFLSQLKKSRGRIISVTSVAGRVALPFCGPYCIAKFGCEAYMDVIRMELAAYGVKCSIIEPGIFRTEILDESQMRARVEKAWTSLSEEMKMEYGIQFKDEFLDAWNQYMMYKSSTQFDYVIDAYFHAITARYPRLRYRCGSDAIFFFIPLSFLPTCIIDYLLRSFSSKKNKLIPSVLLKDKVKQN